MPTPTDPAPCAEGEDLYECLDCGARCCSAERLTSCPDCDGRVENLTEPRSE
ncbi:rubrerythrin-like domain-containing protein [Halorientalis regularis]|nr:rubrerythrin-like domain-containing protein [Halorientalis regularis]